MRVYEMLETAERARERTQKLENELKWVAINQEEQELEKRNQELSTRVTSLEKFSSEVQELGSKKTVLEETIVKLNAEVAKVEAGRNAHSANIASKKTAMQEKKNEFFQVRKKFMGVDGRVKQFKADIRTLDGNIAEVAEQEARDQYEREVEELKGERRATEQEIEGKKEEMKEAQGRIGEMEEKLYTLHASRSTLTRTVANCREQMNQIRDEKDNLAVYGSHIPQLVKTLEKNKARFSQMPLGPIGRYLEVPDQRYKGVVEQLLGSHMGSFIVNTAKDHEVFLQLFTKDFRNKKCPPVIQRQFRNTPHDTSRYGVQGTRNTTSPLEQLKCKNVVVLNTIIDMVRIEQVLVSKGRWLEFVLATAIE